MMAMPDLSGASLFDKQSFLCRRVPDGLFSSRNSRKLGIDQFLFVFFISYLVSCSSCEGIQVLAVGLHRQSCGYLLAIATVLD